MEITENHWIRWDEDCVVGKARCHDFGSKSFFIRQPAQQSSESEKVKKLKSVCVMCTAEGFR